MKNGHNDRRLKRGLALGVAFLILCTPSLSLGWAAGGHMMTASIAFHRLNPRAKAKARELLAIPIDPPDVSKSSRDFVNASHWADDLRPFPEFDPLKPLHFIVKPFSFDGTPLPTDLPTENIVTALEANVEILKNSTDKNAQAKALRLVIHFVGDIHQPLHCATRYSKALPEGNRGGNLFAIRIRGVDGKLKKSNLHSYWDNGIERFPPTGPNFAPPPLSRIPPAVAAAVAGNPDTDPDLKLDDPFNFNAWADESFELAKNVGYAGVRSGKIPNSEYNRKALRVARKRVAWGGYRLAALLNAIWP
jgi:S1/P1 nuclease